MKMDNWIDVDDMHKPPEMKTVMCRFDSMYIGVPFHVQDAHYREGNWYMHGNDRVEDVYGRPPTHWQDMPSDIQED